MLFFWISILVCFILYKLGKNNEKLKDLSFLFNIFAFEFLLVAMATGDSLFFGS